jgi:hypothetical protein
MKRQQFFCCLVALLFAIGLSQAALAQESPENGGGEIATLYALDPLTSHLSLNDGKPGSVVQGNLLYNRDSQLSFDTYERDNFRVGIQGGEVGAIVDLGSAPTIYGPVMATPKPWVTVRDSRQSTSRMVAPSF